MRQKTTCLSLSVLSFILVFLLGTGNVAQAQIPELMYFRFNTATAGVVENDAPVATRVCANGTIMGAMTIAGTGQFGTGLTGTAASGGTDYFNTGWATNLTGSWTISLWMNIPTPPTTRYMFGDGTAASFRCFVGGAASTGLRLTGAVTNNTSNIMPAPVVVHYVYDNVGGTLKSYINGVLDVTTAAVGFTVIGTGPFKIGAYTTSTSIDGVLDEFRMYNRALSATEVAATWNVDVFTGGCAAPTGVNASGVTSGSANLAWNTAASSTGYEYVLSTSATAPTGAGTPIPGTSFTQNGLNFSTTYYLYVRNKCNPTTFSAWSSTSFTTLANPCVQPANLTVNNITLTTANLKWGSAASSTGYEYAVTTSATPPASGTTIPDTSVNKTGLLANTTYYLHVRNVCSPTSQSNWVSKIFATLACTVPANLAVTAPTASSVNFTWNAIPGSLGYEYAITPGAVPPASGTATLNAFGTQGGLTPSYTYYLHVRSKCDPTSFSAWSTFMFVMPQCDPPTNIIISNITHEKADIMWSVMFGAHHYEWIVDQTRDNPGSGATGITTTTSMSDHVANLQPYTWHYVHIRSICFIDDKSAWALDSFMTSPYCAAPAITIGNAGTNNLQIGWEPVSTAISYDFAVTDKDIHPAFGTTITTTSLPVSLPPDGLNYYVHVRAKCLGNFTFSDWSTEPLRIINTGIRNTGNSSFINVYPNPVKDKLVVELDKTVPVGNITISDIAGRVLQMAEVKTNKTEIDISTLPAGMYLLRFAGNGSSHTIKITKQ